MNYTHPNGTTIHVGYRSPGLTAECTPDQKMELALELGMQVIEPQYAAREFPDWEAAEAYKAAADKAGVRIETAGTVLNPVTPDLAATLDERIDKTIRFAQILDISYVFTCVEYPPEEVPQGDSWKLLIDNLRRSVDRLGEAGITLALEPEKFIGSIERMRRLYRLLERPTVRINYDPTNFYLSGSDPLEAFDAFPGLIINGHIKDAVYRTKRHKEVPVGSGEVDYPALLAEIFRRKISLTLHIEHCSAADQVRAAAAAIDPVIRQAIDTPL